MLALGTIAQWWLCIFSIRLWSHVCFTCDKRFTTARSHSLGSSMHTVERVTSLLLQEPFALYPGEELVRAPHFTVAGKTNNADYRAGICPLPVVPPHHAIRLQARVDFMRGDERVKAGDQWQIEGPITYHPESLVVRTCTSRALRFSAPDRHHHHDQNF